MAAFGGCRKVGEHVIRTTFGIRQLVHGSAEYQRLKTRKCEAIGPQPQRRRGRWGGIRHWGHLNVASHISFYFGFSMRVRARTKMRRFFPCHTKAHRGSLFGIASVLIAALAGCQANATKVAPAEAPGARSWGFRRSISS